jgi:hypothetical protein
LDQGSEAAISCAEEDMVKRGNSEYANGDENNLMTKEARTKVLRADGIKEGEGCMDVWKC